MAARTIALVTRSPEETRRVGAAVAAALVPGDVVSLTGDLGAGKTTLVQGAAGALGVTEPVASPTFVLVRQYGGTVPVYHLDVYRLNRLQEVLDLGFDDLLDPSGVMFIEWGSAIEPLLPESYLEIDATVVDEDSARHLVITARGRSWAERWDALGEALGAWRAAS